MRHDVAVIVDQARYHDGHRRSCEDISQTIASIQENPSDDVSDFVWIGLKDPSPDTFQHVVGDELRLHALAIEDAVTGDQRAKIERYDDTWFAVVKPLRYLDATSDIETGELMVFVGPGYVLTVRQGEASPLSHLRQRLEEDGTSLRLGPWGVLHGILDLVVDEYLRIEDELQLDLEAIEEGVFAEDSRVTSQDIYRLKREVLEFKRAAMPLARPLKLLTSLSSPVRQEELRLLFRDVADHLSQATDNVESMDRLLSDVLAAHLAQVGVEQNRQAVQQNEDMRKISAWVAIAALPTMIAGIYGMNFTRIPELTASVHVGGREIYYGYYVVVAFMALACFLLYRLFKRAGWL